MKTDVIMDRPDSKPGGSAVRLRRDAKGSLLLARDGENEVRVYPHLCFPWTAPGRYISLRDREKNEIILLEDFSGLDSASREALEDVMAEARFVFSITAIFSAEADFELRAWKVDTRQGKRRFQTKLDDWPRPLPGGGLLIRDIGGDLYHVEDPHALDAESRKILWAFMD